MNTCVGQPVSWLRLEQYALDELAQADKALVDAHLSDCAVCRASLSHITEDRWRLPALEVPARVRRPRLLAWLSGSAALATAAVLAVMLLRGGAGSKPDLGQIPAREVTIKGAGTVAVDLVRERDGVTALDSARYASGDRFKVLVTCAPGAALHADTVIFQDGAAAFPLAPQTIACGNRVALAGAFRVTGTTEFAVCTVIGEGRAPPRGNLSRRAGASGLARAACITVTPAQ